jgi:hypothetical protein
MPATAHLPNSAPAFLRTFGATMSRRINQEVEFGAKVPSDLYEEFRLLFPMYGANTWFINMALKEFLDIVREDGTLQEKARAAIDRALAERRES